MSWRTVIIQSHCKMNYNNGYLVVRKETIQMIHMSEIHTIMIDSIQASLTSALITEILKRKIKVIFCDDQHNPIGEIIPFYGGHNTSKIVDKQIHWNTNKKDEIWQKIVQQKIMNQAAMLKLFFRDGFEKLEDYAFKVEICDRTNREGHAAKLYFNSLFGHNFTRDEECNVNSALNYGYTLLLSTFNREVVSQGYITQIGIHHRNEYNFFNLSCDLMEPCRVFVDEVVYLNREKIFDQELKSALINVLNRKVKISDSEHYLTNAIQIFVKSIFRALESDNVDELKRIEVK